MKSTGRCVLCFSSSKHTHLSYASINILHCHLQRREHHQGHNCSVPYPTGTKYLCAIKDADQGLTGIGYPNAGEQKTRRLVSSEYARQADRLMILRTPTILLAASDRGIRPILTRLLFSAHLRAMPHSLIHVAASASVLACNSVHHVNQCPWPCDPWYQALPQHIGPHTRSPIRKQRHDLACRDGRASPNTPTASAAKRLQPLSLLLPSKTSMANLELDQSLATARAHEKIDTFGVSIALHDPVASHHDRLSRA